MRISNSLGTLQRCCVWNKAGTSWWNVLWLRHTRCRISMGVIHHQIPGKPIVYHFCWKLWLGLGVSSWWKFNSNGFFLGINFVDFGRNMLQFQIYFTLRRFFFENMPPWSTMVNRPHRNSIAFSSKKSRIWKSCVLDLCVKFTKKNSTLKVNALIVWNLRDVQWSQYRTKQR